MKTLVELRLQFGGGELVVAGFLCKEPLFGSAAGDVGIAKIALAGHGIFLRSGLGLHSPEAAKAA